MREVVTSPLFWTLLGIAGAAGAFVCRDAFSWFFFTTISAVVYPVVWYILAGIFTLLVGLLTGGADFVDVTGSWCATVATAGLFLLHLRSLRGSDRQPPKYGTTAPAPHNPYSKGFHR